MTVRERVHLYLGQVNMPVPELVLEQTPLLVVVLVVMPVVVVARLMLPLGPWRCWLRKQAAFMGRTHCVEAVCELLKRQAWPRIRRRPRTEPRPWPSE